MSCLCYKQGNCSKKEEKKKAYSCTKGMDETEEVSINSFLLLFYFLFLSFFSDHDHIGQGLGLTGLMYNLHNLQIIVLLRAWIQQSFPPELNTMSRTKCLLALWKFHLNFSLLLVNLWASRPQSSFSKCTVTDWAVPFVLHCVVFEEPLRGFSECDWRCGHMRIG